MYKISVIVPVYNVETYLRQCLDSIINQTLTDIEIICINDGSTDTSPDILKEYESRDSRIRIISQENKGLSSARNRGLEVAVGEYIYFIDSDDYLDVNALDELYSLSKDKDLDLILFKLANFDDEGNVDYNYSNMPFLLDIPKDVFTYRDFKDDLFRVDVTAYTKFFKRELVSDMRFPEGLIFEDSAVYLDYIINAKRICFLDKCLYYRRIRDDSIISKASKNHADIIEIYEIINGKLIECGLYDELKEDFFARKTDIIYYRFNSINPKYKDYFYKKMKENFLSHNDEYENVLNQDKIPDYCKNIFEAVIMSEEFGEIELYITICKLKKQIKDLKKKNKKIKRENKKLKKDIESSKPSKIIKGLKKLKRR